MGASKVQKIKDDEKKQSVDGNNDENVFLKEANLNESAYANWTMEQVSAWIAIKQGWSGKLDGYEQNKVNGYKEKLFAQQVDGAKLIEMQQDMQIAKKTLKSIGFPFSMIKKVYKSIQELGK